VAIELGHKLDGDIIIPLPPPAELATPSIDDLLERESKKLVIGVDPGGNGALATIEILTGAITVIDMPTIKVTVGGTPRLRVDPITLAAWLREKAPYCALACVEKAAPRSHDGPGSALNTGAAWGLVVGILHGLGVPVLDADPAKWKPSMKVTADKDTSRARACLLWPEMAQHFHLKKHDGRAEAVLIAMYGIIRAQKIKHAAGMLPAAQPKG